MKGRIADWRSVLAHVARREVIDGGVRAVFVPSVPVGELILAVLAAIGLGAAAGFALFGTVAVVVGAVLMALVVVRRRRRASACAITQRPATVAVELTDTRSRS